LQASVGGGLEKNEQEKKGIGGSLTRKCSERQLEGAGNGELLPCWSSCQGN